MAILITYPEDKFSEEMLAGLDKRRPLFLPLKRIEYLDFNQAIYQKVADADCLVVTSMLAIQALVKSDISTNKRIAVISPKAASLLRSFKFTNLIVSKIENRQSLVEQLNQIFTADQKVVFLKGNLASDLPLNAQVDNITVYKNVWTGTDRDEAIRKMAGLDFTKVLVTSPSAFYRLEEIMEIIPSQFMTTKYYTLGHTTQRIMTELGFDTYAPVHARNVLKQVILKMTREQ
ncbi:uroporphyrinogen-III synthase [Companilactobacillus versmoldensis]|nr:uroporphyrinogen-III synthase [Companilactobacillus versmoldensis]